MTLSSNRRTPGCLREVAGRAVLTSHRECVVVIWIGMWTVRQRTRAVQRRATGARASSFGEKLERRKGGDTLPSLPSQRSFGMLRSVPWLSMRSLHKTTRALRGNTLEFNMEPDISAAIHDARRNRRRRRERADSVNETILADRQQHIERMASVDVEEEVLRDIRSLQLGRKRQFHNQKRADQRRRTIADQLEARAVLLGKTGVGMHHDWDRLNRERLPEIVILGHSNCGKSSLLNALIGARARSGPAEVSARAGWTADLGFYRVRPRAPRSAQQGTMATSIPSLGLIMVDTPGYGFAVGDRQQLQAWGELLADYLDNSTRLRLGLLLVDATRGLCEADVRVLRRVCRANVPVMTVLTKADLLEPDDLAASHAVICAQLADAVPRGVRVSLRPLMLSAHFLSGVKHFWHTLLAELDDILARSEQDTGHCDDEDNA